MLAIIPAMFGIAGIHRFFMRRTGTGVLYLFSWGLFGFGTLYDLITMPKHVDRYNSAIDAADTAGDLPRAQDRPVVKVRCRYCGALNDQQDNRCEACGSSL